MSGFIKSSVSIILRYPDLRTHFSEPRGQNIVATITPNLKLRVWGIRNTYVHCPLMMSYELFPRVRAYINKTFLKLGLLYLSINNLHTIF